MRKRLIWMPLALVAFIVLAALCVANRQPTSLILAPFRPDAPQYSLVLPLYAELIGALTLGVVLGGLATWYGQGRWRKTARLKAQDAMRWQADADRLARERDASVGAVRPALGVQC